jgi:DNA-binding LytR/AlgR family response regulator
MITTNLMTKKRSRIIVRKRDENIALNVTDVVFIYRDDTLVLVFDNAEKKYLCDKNLAELEAELDETIFFRANRQFIININFVKSFKTFEKVKLQVFLKIPHPDHPIIISQKRGPIFKKWLSEE